MIGDGYDVGFKKSGYHIREIYADDVGLRVNIVDLVVYHMWVVLVVDEADFGVFAEFGAVDEVVICFEECGAFRLDYFAVYHERGDDVIKNGITEFGVEIVANGENPVFGAIVVCVNHDVVDVALFLLYSQVFKDSDDIRAEKLGIEVE